MLDQIHRRLQSKVFSFSCYFCLPSFSCHFPIVEFARNELLRALDLRLTALKEEILVLLNKAVGSNLSTRDISDLSTFVQQFGPSEFRYVTRALYTKMLLYHVQ
jgi:hypothetical protein